MTERRIHGYCRVSSKEQALHGVSLDAQAQRIADYAKLKEWRVVEVIRDEGVSGKDQNRPGLNRLRELIKAGRVDVLVVSSLDRISRSTVDVGNLIELFNRCKVSFVSLRESWDCTTAMGVAMMSLATVLSQFERDMGAERTRDALRFKRLNGQVYCNPPPYGYDAVDGKLVSNAKQQVILDRIAAMRGAGLGYHKVARILNDDGVLSPQGKLWSGQGVSYITKRLARDLEDRNGD